MIDFTQSNASDSQENTRQTNTESSVAIPQSTPDISNPNNANNSQTQKPRSDSDNVVFVGSKHLMNYVNSIDMQLKKSPEVIIKARGKFISKAVDIVEVAKRQNNTKMSVKDIKIGTEEYENEGKKVKVSTVDIILNR
jgi:archaea-specific DNA-binding protein